MQLIKTKDNGKCGDCRHTSEEGYVLTLGKSVTRLCKSCLKSLYSSIGERIVPKSIETAKPRAERYGGEK